MKKKMILSSILVALCISMAWFVGSTIAGVSILSAAHAPAFKQQLHTQAVHTRHHVSTLKDQATTPPQLSTVPSSILTQRGFTLGVPVGTPTVSKEAALQVASQQFGPSMQVRETVLAEVTKS